MDHIDRNGGRFVSVLPASRKQDGAFRTWLVTHEANWTEALRRPGRRHADPDDVYATTEAPWPSAEGLPMRSPSHTGMSDLTYIREKGERKALCREWEQTFATLTHGCRSDH